MTFRAVYPCCGKFPHDWVNEEALQCIPPRHVLQFGPCRIDHLYREALYQRYPSYTAEEVLGSFMGHNPHFPGHEDWLDEQLGEKKEENTSGAEEEALF